MRPPSTSRNKQPVAAGQVHTTDLEPTPSLLSRHKDKLIMAGLGLTVLTLFSTLIFRSSALTNQFIPLSLTSSTNTTGSVQPVPDATAAGGSYLKFVSTGGGGGGPSGKRCVVGLAGAEGGYGINGNFGSGGNYPQGDWTTIDTEGPGNQWLSDYAMQLGIINDRINQVSPDCGQIIVHGFSSGGGMAANMACRGETLGGRVIGYIVDDNIGWGGGACNTGDLKITVYGCRMGGGQWFLTSSGFGDMDDTAQRLGTTVTEKPTSVCNGSTGPAWHTPYSTGNYGGALPPEYSTWWNDGTSNPGTQPNPDPPSSTTPSGFRCMIFLHGVTGTAESDLTFEGGVQVRPGGNYAFNGGGRQWRLGNDADYNSAMAIINASIEGKNCGQIILAGFSNGANAAANIYCNGESFGGRLIGTILNDPPTDSAVIGCNPFPGQQLYLALSVEFRNAIGNGGSPCGEWYGGCEGNLISHSEYANHLGVSNPVSVPGHAWGNVDYLGVAGDWWK